MGVQWNVKTKDGKISQLQGSETISVFRRGRSTEQEWLIKSAGQSLLQSCLCGVVPVNSEQLSRLLCS